MVISPFPCWEGNESTTGQLKAPWDQRRMVREDTKAGEEEGALQAPSGHGHLQSLGALCWVTKTSR